MYVYTETNFILEIALSQEQHQSCETLVQMCKTRQIILAVPAYSIAESYETIIRRSKSRKEQSDKFRNETQQLTRSIQYQGEVENIRSILSILTKSIEEEKNRLDSAVVQIIASTEIISLDAEILNNSLTYQQSFGLLPQDSIVLASVISHITSHQITESCFINQNSKDFNNPDIDELLKQQNCKMITKFDQGLNYVRSRFKQSS